MKKNLTSEEFEEWVKQYGLSRVKNREIEINKAEWDKCYCSDLPRALETAKHIYEGEIYKTKLIREVPLRPFIKTKFRFSHMFWSIFGRLAWLFSHKSQTESKINLIY